MNADQPRVWVTRAARSVATLPGRTPLRITLVAVVLALVAVALTGTGFAGTIFLRRYLEGRVDDQLKGAIRGATASGPSASMFPGPPLRGGDRGRPDNGFRPMQKTAFFLLFVDDAGNPIASPANEFAVPDGPAQTSPRLPRLDAAGVRAAAGHHFTVEPVGAGDRWLVRVAPMRAGGGSAVVAITLTEVDPTVAKLGGYDALIGVVTLIVIGVLGYVLVRRSLRRLVEVEHTAEAIAAGDLGRRVPAGDPRTEVGRLTVALNAMLGQIERAFTAQLSSEAQARASEERMRRFVADASHELRTPLTAIRGFAELHRRRQLSARAPVSADLPTAGLPPGGAPRAEMGPVAAADDALARIEQHATRMGLLVEDLLLLARLDQQRPLERRPVDLLEIAVEALADAAVTAPDHPVRLRVTAGPGDAADGGAPPVVTGDREWLRQVLGNLLSNAFTHTPPGTAVTVELTASGECVVMSVADTGPGMSADDAARVFERFYRTDPSRTRAQGGSGLGLAIVASLVAAHGGTVDLRTAPGAGATFEVRLPLHSPSTTTGT